MLSWWVLRWKNLTQRRGSLGIVSFLSLPFIALGCGVLQSRYPEYVWLNISVVTSIAALGAFASAWEHRKQTLAREELATALEDIASSSALEEAAAAPQAGGVSSACEQVLEVLGEAVSISRVAEEVVQLASKTRGQSQQIVDTLETANQISQKMSEAIAKIERIAERSDLIALNASLEASRTGTGATVFGTIAGEMRRLARLIAESTSEITGLLTGTQNHFESIASSSEEGARLAEDASSRAKSIAAGSVKQCDAVQNVLALLEDVAMSLVEHLEATKETQRRLSTHLRSESPNNVN